MGEGNKGHQCECNLCGDTLSDRAMDETPNIGFGKR